MFVNFVRNYDVAQPRLRCLCKSNTAKTVVITVVPKHKDDNKLGAKPVAEEKQVSLQRTCIVCNIIMSLVQSMQD